MSHHSKTFNTKIPSRGLNQSMIGFKIDHLTDSGPSLSGWVLTAQGWWSWPIALFCRKRTLEC